MSLVFPFAPNIERGSTIPARIYNDPVYLESIARIEPAFAGFHFRNGALAPLNNIQAEFGSNDP